MADLSTLAVIESELAATADYDASPPDTAKAYRRVAALRRKLDFPQSVGRGEQNISFALTAIEKQIEYILAWLANNPTDAQQFANPSVLHADFSTFRGYR